MSVTKTRILLVDDRQENLLSLEAILEDDHVEIYKADNGPKALRLALKHDFAVMLLDVQMPEMDGFEVARLMRSSSRTANVPIIFVTGIGDSRQQIFSGYEAGAVDYLVKPLEPRVVQSKVAIFRELFEQRMLLRRQAAELSAHVRQLEATRHSLEEQTAALERSEGELQALNAGLEDLVAARTLELEISNKQLEAFVYSASHNLKTPLRSIISFISILVDDLGAQLSSEDLGMLERVGRSANDMWELLATLLRLSRLSAHRLQRERIDLCAIAERVGAGLAAEDSDRKVALRLCRASVVEADAMLATLLLTLLLENAWKYTGPRDHATVEFGLVPDSAPRIWFVRDDGVGFDREYSDKLFVPFQRLHSPTEFDGAGLGLATARQIVRMHDGRIWAESVVGEGATFYFTLEPELERLSPGPRTAPG